MPDVNSIVPIILTLLSMAGTVLLLLLNAKVSNAVESSRTEIQKSRADFQTAINAVQLDVSAMRTEFAKEQAGLYKEVIAMMQRTNENMQNAYMNRSESERMHKENKERLDAIESQLGEMRGAIALSRQPQHPQHQGGR